MLRKRWVGLLVGLLLLCGLEARAQTTVNANYNDSRIFAGGASGAASGSYATTLTGYIFAFNFSGSQVQMRLHGYFNVSVDGGANVAITPNMSNGLNNTVWSGTDGAHTIVITSTNVTSECGTATPVLAVTGATPSISSSSIYTGTAYKVAAVGQTFGNEVAFSSSYIRVDGAFGTNVGGNNGGNMVGSNQNCWGGSVTFWTSSASIAVETSTNEYGGPGGLWVIIDGNPTPTYYPSNLYNGGGATAQGIYTVISGLDTTVAHKYELRLGWSYAGIQWSDIVLSGALNTTHTLPVRKSVLIEGDSVVRSFISGTHGSGSPEPDGAYDVYPGDIALGLSRACIQLDLAFTAKGILGDTLNQLKAVGTILGTDVSASYVNADFVFLEAGINGLDTTDQMTFQADEQTSINNVLAFSTNANVHIFAQNIFHNSVDDTPTSTNGMLLAARRLLVAAAVTAVGNSKAAMIDVSTWFLTSDTEDGTHPNASGQTKISAKYVTILGSFINVITHKSVTSRGDRNSGRHSGRN